MKLPPIPPFTPFHAVQVRRMNWRGFGRGRRRYSRLWNRARRAELRAFAAAQRLGRWLQARIAGMKSNPND